MPGLTRASIYIARDFSKQMDCRVKPGNDILMAFARNTRRDREAVFVHGGLFENRIHRGRHYEECKRRNLIRRHSGMVRRTRPQMRNCASGNLEIPGSMLRIAPE